MSPDTRLFIRDDDVGELTEALRFFVETFLSRRIPVSYQIIPARFTQEAADFLLEAWARHPDLIEFGQHGLRHEMTVRGRRDLREFGPERSLAEQKAVIAEGLDILRDRLKGGPEIRVFTPPRHKYDRSTVIAAAAAGHEIFSAAYYPSAHHQLAYRIGRHLGLSSLRHHGISYHGRQRPEAPIEELSISVAVDDGNELLSRQGEIVAAMNRGETGTKTVGLMFHHEIYWTTELRTELTSIAAELSAHGHARFHPLGRIAPSPLSAAALDTHPRK